MAEIRPMQREDLPAVAALVKEGMRSWRRDLGVLERALVDHPWAPPELPTLVALDDAGQIIGSIGAQRRRLLFDGRELDAVSVSHLVVAADSRGGAAGALLVRRLLGGGQDLTWTDSGTREVARIWRAFGAYIDYTRSSNWMLVLRPAAWLARVGRLRARSDPLLRQTVPVTAVPVQMLDRRRGRRAAPRPLAGVASEESSAAQIAEELPLLGRGFRLRLDYDAAYLDWAFDYIGSLGAPVRARLVRRAGRPIGWYAYIAQDGVSRVIHLAAVDREIDPVFDDLSDHCREQGALVLAGRLEPHLHEPLRRNLAVIGLAQRPIVHARDSQLLATVATSASLITEMDLIDSEWW